MTISARLRRDPQKGKKEFSAHNGFTVVELMIVVAVLAIITSLALPSYRAIVEKRRVTSAAEQLTAFLSSAQMESVKRNLAVAVTCTTASGGCEAVVLEDGEDLDEGESLRTIQFVNLNATVVPENDFSLVVFDPVRGMLAQEYIDASPYEMALTSPQGEYALNIRMLPTGRITMCSDTGRASKIVPGYDVCVQAEES